MAGCLAELLQEPARYSRIGGCCNSYIFRFICEFFGPLALRSFCIERNARISQLQTLVGYRPGGPRLAQPYHLWSPHFTGGGFLRAINRFFYRFAVGRPGRLTWRLGGFYRHAPVGGDDGISQLPLCNLSDEHYRQAHSMSSWQSVSPVGSGFAGSRGDNSWLCARESSSPPPIPTGQAIGGSSSAISCRMPCLP